MLIGFNARLFPGHWRPARQEIAFAQANGFAAIQFPGPEQGLDATRLGDSLAVIADMLQQARLTAVMEMVIRINEEGRTETGVSPLDVLEANLPAITALPCAYIHWHLVPIRPIKADRTRQVEEMLIPQLMAGVALAHGHDFQLGFEHNEPDLRLCGTPAACAALLAAVPSLKFVWDLNHTIPAHLADFLALTPQMSILHVSDTPLPEVNYHLPLGLGSLDFPAYCRALKAGGFQGPAILEIGGLPKSGGYGRDTDAALLDSQWRLKHILRSL